jgi:hypothetical protein
MIRGSMLADEFPWFYRLRSIRTENNICPNNAKSRCCINTKGNSVSENSLFLFFRFGIVECDFVEDLIGPTAILGQDRDPLDGITLGLQSAKVLCEIY